MATDQDSMRELSVNLDNTTEDDPALRTSIKVRPTRLHPAVGGRAGESAASLLDHDEAVLDTGWNRKNVQNSQSLLDGMSNEDLWLLIRRFNKHVLHVKALPKPPPDGLDFSVTEEENFSPDKLRAQLERLYMGLLIGLLGFVQHLARLRSWGEPRRTAFFCFIYFLSWCVDYLMPVFLITMAALIVSPRLRRIMFPPAPIALVDYKTGRVSKPPAGVLGSVDSATGAPENAKGEAVENEASNFITGLAAMMLNTLTDKDPQEDENQKGGGMIDRLPEPNELATKVAVIKDKATGVDRPSQDKTKSPMEKMMWSQMSPLMHGMCVVSASWERWKNLLNPPRPLSSERRQRLLALILTLLAFSTFSTCYIVYKVVTLAVGLKLFGDPILTRINTWLDLEHITISKYRRLSCGTEWLCRAMLMPEFSTILKGVPTDAQLTISLLRFGEANKVPLEPPPQAQEAPSQEPVPLGDGSLGAAGGDQPLGATKEEIQQAAEPDEEMLREAGGDDHEFTETGSQGQRRDKLFGVFKHSAKAVTKTLIGIDKMRAKAGSKSAQKRVGVVSFRDEPAIGGPVEFNARYRGEKGFIYLTTDAISPSICFSTEPAKEGTGNPDNQQLQPEWVVPIAEIRELKKYSGYGAKSKLLAGWALDRQVMDGLEIIDKQGNAKVVTALPRRDQLFNRLCAMGGQIWEVC